MPYNIVQSVVAIAVAAGALSFLFADTAVAQRAPNDPSVITRQKNPDGTVTKTRTNKRGETVTTTRDASGKIIERKTREPAERVIRPVPETRQRDAGGNIVVVKHRPDGAEVTIIRDRSGNLISRTVRNDPRRSIRDFHVTDSRVETLPDGGTRIVRRRDDGRVIKIIRNRDGQIIRRSELSPGDRETVIFEGRYRRRYRRNGLEVFVYTPFELSIAPELYIVESERATPLEIETTFLAAPLRKLDRRYSIKEVMQNSELRAHVRRVDVDTITFASGDAEIPPKQIKRLDRIANAIFQIAKRKPRSVFLIEGHTDATGSEEFNLALSEARAASVKQALVDTYDINPRNLVVKGYGEAYLKIPTQGPEARNRRVTVLNLTQIIAENR